MMSKETAVLISILTVICLMFILGFILPMADTPYGDYFYTIRFNFIWVWTAIIVSLIMIIKMKIKIDMLDLSAGILLGLLGASGDIAVLICIAAVYVNSKEMMINSQLNIRFMDYRNVNAFLKDLLFVIFIGGILGILNVMLSMNYKEMHLNFGFLSFYRALQPGITEEIIYRLFILCIAVYFTKDNIAGKLNKILLMVLLIVPHTAVHYLDKIHVFEIGEIIKGGFILSVLYGLPISILLLKKGLFAAIGVHVVIDFIRFCVFYQ